MKQKAGLNIQLSALPAASRKTCWIAVTVVRAQETCSVNTANAKLTHQPARPQRRAAAARGVSVQSINRL